MGDFQDWGAEISRRKNLNHPAAPVQSHLLQSGRTPSSGKTKVSTSLCKLLYRLMATSAWMTCSSIFGSYGVMSTLAGLSNYRRRQKQNIQITSFDVKEKTRTHTKKPSSCFSSCFSSSKCRQISSFLIGSGCIVFCTPDLPSCLLEGVLCVSPMRGISSRCGPRGSR